MKKLLTTLCVAAVAFGAHAQDDNLLQFFPNKKGTQIVSKTYDANDILQATMTMTIMSDYEYYDGQDLDITYVIEDADGNLVNQGKIDAQYMDGNFYFGMNSLAMSPSIGQYVSTLTDLSGDFLDYPNLFPDPMMLQSDFQMDGGSFTIKSAEDKKDVIASVEVRGRNIEGTEKVTTPAGTFDTTKISFYVDVHDKGAKATYRGVEWYSAGSGIVRSEIYDQNHNLLDYTVLTSITE